MASPWGLPVQADHIPAALKIQPRWIVWKAEWLETKQKWNKVPRQPGNPDYNLIAGSAWATFDTAFAAYRNGHALSGVGFKMDGIDDDLLFDPLVAIDLDKCIEDGAIADWAQQIVDALPTYWERSPSGEGLRGFCYGTIDSEINIRDPGIEMYNGTSGRFLTVTGSRVPGTTQDIQAVDASALRALHARYAKNSTEEPTLADRPPRPELLKVDEIPKMASFLLSGNPTSDRASASEALFSDLRLLARHGFNAQLIYSTAAISDIAHNTARAHRPRRGEEQQIEASLDFLWRESHKAHRQVEADTAAVFESFEVIDAPAPANPPKAIPPWRELFQDLTAFAADLTPVRFVWEPVIQAGYIYALSGHSNAGKTALALAISEAVAAGSPLGPYPTEHGTVLFLAGENPQNIQMRGKGMTELGNLTPGVLVMTEVGDLKDYMGRLREMCEWHASDEAKALGVQPINLIFIDSKLIYFQGESEDDNKQARDQALRFKAITELPGIPAVVVLSHPSKTIATQQALEPRGGGAFLNQIDGNLTAWSEGDGYTTLHWAKKLRGITFDPITFELVQHELEGQKMLLSGDPVTTVVAVIADEGRLKKSEVAAQNMENWTLLMLAEDPLTSIRAMCVRLGLGESARNRVNRAVWGLERANLIRPPKVNRAAYVVTKKGKDRALELLDNGVVLPGF